MPKRFYSYVCSLTVVCLLSLLLITTSCGGGAKGPVVQGFSPGSSCTNKTSPGERDAFLDEACAELEALETPEGVDAALFARLKAALKEALLYRARTITGGAGVPPVIQPTGEKAGRGDHAPRGKFALAVPADEGNSVELVVTDEGGPHLVWSEINLGDYDLNATVGIADITPLAMFYGHSEGDAEWDAWHEAVDGSGDDQISIDDITPIAMHYGMTVSGYRVMRHPGGAGDWEFLDEVERPYDPSQPGEAKERPEYVYDDAAPLADAYYAVQPADGEYNYGISSNVASFGSPAGPEPDPPPVESGEPGPDEIVLSLGEAVMLDEITDEESYTLRTSSDEEYLLVLTSPNEIEEGSDPEDDFQVAASYTASGASAVSALPPMANRSWDPPGHPSFMPDRAQQEKEIVERYARAGASAVRRIAAVDDERDFDIVFLNGNMNDVDDTITARCTNVGTLADIWVDLRVDDGRIAQSWLDELSDWLDNRIVEAETTTYGAVMDPDEDGKMVVVLTPSINELPGLVGGMFVANDLQPASPGSNSADIVYCQVPDASGEFDAGSPISEEDFLGGYISTAAHELQHLINFSNRLRIYLAGEPEDPFVGEEVWLNEALSHFTEDWSGFQPQNNFVSPDNYLTATPWVSLPGGNSWNPSIFRRGAGYLMIRYLADRFGESILPQLLQRDETELPLYGWGNVHTAAGEDLTTVLLSNGVAMYAAALGLTTSAQYSYDEVSYDGETSAQHGVYFRGWNESFTGAEYSLTEPLAYLLSPDGPASRTFVARENALLFVRLLPGEVSSCSLTITSLGGKPIRGAVLRIDSGEVVREAEAGNLADGGFVLGSLSTAEEVDPFEVTIPAPRPYVFRVVALTADIEEFTFSINGSAKPNMALDPTTMNYGPPGVYQLRSNLTTAGTYDIDLASPDGTGEYYLLVLPY